MVGEVDTAPVANFNFSMLVVSDSMVGVKPSIFILRLLPSPIVIPGASTFRYSSCPKVVKLEATTFGAKVFPVRVSAGTGKMISSVPSNAIVLIVLLAVNRSALAEMPLKVLPVILFTMMSLKVLVPAIVVTLPNSVPTNSPAETVVAEKLPVLSLATTLPIKFSGVASMSQVSSNAPLKSEPSI